MKKYIKYLPYLAWVQAIVATVGSLFFSEVMKYPACSLCWYQRIFVYPLVLIIPIGIWKKDKNLSDYVLPLSIIGLLVAFYQNLLYYAIIPENLAPCSNGVSCTTKFFELGFISIPLLSLCGFVVITAAMLIFRNSKQKWD